MNRIQIQVKQTIDGKVKSKGFTVNSDDDYLIVSGRIEGLFDELFRNSCQQYVKLKHMI